MNLMTKVATLAWLAMTRPAEFLDRMEAIITARFEKHFGIPGSYTPQRAEEIISFLCKYLKGTMDWQGANEIEQEVRDQMKELKAKAPFTTRHHGDFSLARVSYAACRILRPDIVVETGVAYGVTTAFILKALALNQKGRLISIDLPPLGHHADSFVGFLVPEMLKSRWMFYRGTSKRLLPMILQQMGKVDMFVHDSLHTYWNIMRELNMVTPFLARPSIVISDDIQGNKAFGEWRDSVNPSWAAAFEEDFKKDTLAGIALFL